MFSRIYALGYAQKWLRFGDSKFQCGRENEINFLSGVVTVQSLVRQSIPLKQDL